MAVLQGLLYTKSHEWVKEEGGEYLVGITDYAQAELGDLVFINLPEVGDAVTMGSRSPMWSLLRRFPMYFLL